MYFNNKVEVNKISFGAAIANCRKFHGSEVRDMRERDAIVCYEFFKKRIGIFKQTEFCGANKPQNCSGCRSFELERH